MKTIKEIEKEYDSYQVESKFVTNYDELISFLLIGIDDTYAIEKECKKEYNQNRIWQIDGKIRNFLSFIFESEEVEFYDYDNSIIFSIIELIETYRTYFKKIINVANEDNYKELVKLTDFIAKYYGETIDYYEFERDRLEAAYKGFQMSNSKYENNQKIISEFFNNKIQKYEKNKEKKNIKE